MKKTVTILSVLAFLAGNCGQAMKKQAETVTENNVENPVTQN